MTESLYQKFREILAASGIPVMEGFPAGPAVQPRVPTLAVLLEGLDPDAGILHGEVRVLSPRNLGGWACQTAAASAAQALYQAGVVAETRRMDYLPAVDCYCIPIGITAAVQNSGTGWTLAIPVQVDVGNVQVKHLILFSARQELHRRIIQPVCQKDPRAVSPPVASGWILRLVRRIPAGEKLPGKLQEPFSVRVLQNNGIYIYRQCFWDGEEIRSGPDGTELEQWGFALVREVNVGQNEA